MSSCLKALLRGLLQARPIASALALGLQLTGGAHAFDNNVLPPFEMEKEKRGFTWLSIHPDGQQWLVSECTNRLGVPLGSCYLFLYHLKTGAYRRYALPEGYMYTDGQFSPSGRQIVAIRRPQHLESSRKEQERVYAGAELVVMNTDGSGFRVLPVPKGIIKRPAMSPGEDKLAYWKAQAMRPPNSKTTLTNFDVREFDLRSGEDRMFAGSFQFFNAQSLRYVSSDELLLGADFPSGIGVDVFSYHERFGHNQIYRLKRGSTALPAPAFSKVSYGSNATVCDNGRAYVLGEPLPDGTSIVEFDKGGIRRRWRIPRLTNDSITVMTVSAGSTHAGFIYPTSALRSGDLRTGLGMFDMQKEAWLPVSLPLPEKASPLDVHP